MIEGFDRSGAAGTERTLREARLAALESRAGAGAGVDFERATLLDELGRVDSARSAYLEVLGRDSTHVGALNGLGRLLDRTGHHRAARTVLLRAVEAHPDDAASHGNLATVLLDAGDVDAARRHYETALRLEPDNLSAHQCLAILLLRRGDEQAAAAHGRIGFRDGATAWPYRGEAAPIPVLVIHSALGGNVPIDRFIDDATFAKSTIVAEFYPPALPLPPHAFVVNVIGDASRCRRALEAAQTLIATTSAPVLNPPARVAQTSRDRTAARLAGLPDVVAPRTALFARAALEARAAPALLERSGFAWPVIVRAPGFQTGQHCVLVERPDRLAAAVATLPGDELLVIQFIDVRGADGNVRKYRVMLIDAAVYPLHLAVSRDWMVHYFRAETAARAEHRAEEAAFLAAPPEAVGSQVSTALAAIAGRLGLDYGGIDFAIDARGRVVVFEANATMVVPPSAAETVPARRVAVERIERAVRSMLLERAPGAAPG